MFGWRAQIGFISPAPGGPPTSLLEMQAAAPDGVVFLARMLDGPRSLELADLVAMAPQIGPAAASLAAQTELDLVLMAGAPIVLGNGPDEVIRIMSEASGVPATTNVQGIVRAIQRLDLARVVVLAPYYPAHLVDRFEEHLTANGIATIIVPPGQVPFGSHKDQAAELTYRRAKRAFREQPADGIVLLGGGTPLQAILQPLETDLAVPVIANNQANLWNALTMAGVREPIAGMGRLMTCF
ncbi:MAG TPA: aspartate/glutamate racemase family protein [Candidatus Limnocylindrales bacterium]|nr:aspartate/glutamate racemase family protein [Candidatus Limnocylindrales bacterium]